MIYYDKNSEPELTVYQEDLRKIGINLNLRLVTFETMYSVIESRKFQMGTVGLTGLLFPNPETQFLSPLADRDNTNNFTGFKNARVDELCKEYDKMFNVQDRIRAVREIDAIVANDYQFVLTWDSPNVRIAFWNKFGSPAGYLSRTGDQYGTWSLWWDDPDKDAKLKQALNNPSIKLDVEPTDDRYWVDYGKTHPFSQ